MNNPHRSEDIRNIIWAFTLSFLLLAAWKFFFAPKPEEVAAQKAAIEAEKTQNTDSNTQNIAADGSVSETINNAQAAALKNVPLAIISKRVTGSINLQGGAIDNLALNDYHESLEKDAPITLLQNTKNNLL